MLKFDVKTTDGNARAGRLEVNGRKASTPMFMPVATRGSVRTLLSKDLKELGVEALISNMYHLLMRPGADIIQEVGGLHEFMNWDGVLFTDSGGFQMIRKGFEQDIKENKVRFKSELDGTVFELTPTDDVELQLKMDTDVAMCLDYCPPYPADRETLEASVNKTTRWAEECRKVDGDIFGISQGGIEPDLRAKSCQALVDIGFQGYALGGLSIGEPKEKMYAMFDIADEIYPKESPRYVMGLGSPVEMLEAIDRGMDIFDSAYPTRNARHGSILTHCGSLDIRKAKFKKDKEPLDPDCDCSICSEYSRAYINHLCRAEELSWMRMATLHNLHFTLSIFKESRSAIADGSFKEYKEKFLKKYG